MGRRWTKQEEEQIAEVRRRLHKELSECPPFPEVVGDRRIIRFLRGKQHNIDEASAMMKDFLIWRKKNNVDDIRQEIVYGGRDSPFKFPNGKFIIKLVPQIIITPHSRDLKCRPLSMELLGFNPKEVFKKIPREDFLKFLTYALEYRSIVMEQLSDELEQQYLQDHPDPESRKDGYGVMLLFFCIRDLKGVGLGHLGSEGRSIVGAALELGLNNYSEFLGKNILTNVPWIFNAMWSFVKGLLDEYTLAKITLCGTDFMDSLLKEMTLDNIPAAVGGPFQLYNEPFAFNTAPGGPLHYPNCETDALPYLQRKFDFERNDKEEYCYYYNGITPPDSIYLINPNESTRTNASSIAEPGISSKEEVFYETGAKVEETHFTLESPSSDIPQTLPDRLDLSTQNEGIAPPVAKPQILNWCNEFGLFCLKDNPIRLLLLIFLLIISIFIHPHFFQSIIPAVGLCVFFVYLASTENYFM